MNRRLRTVLLAAVVLPILVAARKPAIDLPILDDGLGTLQDAFNAARGTPRFVALLAPT